MRTSSFVLVSFGVTLLFASVVTAAPSGEGSEITCLSVTPGTTVRELLEEHARGSEAFERIVYELNGHRLRESVALIINGRVIELAGGLDRELQQGDELLLLPGFSGG